MTRGRSICVLQGEPYSWPLPFFFCPEYYRALIHQSSLYRHRRHVVRNANDRAVTLQLSLRIIARSSARVQTLAFRRSRITTCGILTFCQVHELSSSMTPRLNIFTSDSACVVLSMREWRNYHLHAVRINVRIKRL